VLLACADQQEWARDLDCAQCEQGRCATPERSHAAALDRERQEDERGECCAAEDHARGREVVKADLDEQV
jgi:hypothetical protein